MPCPLPVVPGHRARRAALRLHRAHGAGPVRGARLPRRALLGRALQDHRGCLQGTTIEALETIFLLFTLGKSSIILDKNARYTVKTPQLRH